MAPLFLTLQKDRHPYLVLTSFPLASATFSLNYLGLQGTRNQTVFSFSPDSKFSGGFCVISSSVPLDATRIWGPCGRVYGSSMPYLAAVYSPKYFLLHVRWLFILLCIMIKPLLYSGWPGLHSHYFTKLFLFSLRHQ